MLKMLLTYGTVSWSRSIQYTLVFIIMRKLINHCLVEVFVGLTSVPSSQSKVTNKNNMIADQYI